ncbi:MAG: glycosyltransferase [Candidatus Omnitrophica bacterium]|nr:glycosyltransferase [Candidatus Omnitrophota bacterium]
MQNRRIKITLLIDVLEDIKGGAERQVYELLKRIDRKKFEIYLYVLHQKDVPVQIKETGIFIKCLGVKRIYGSTGIKQGLRFMSFLKEEGIDILMTYHFSSDIWGAFFGHLAKVPAIVSNRRDVGFWRKPVHVLFYKLIDPWVKKVIANSNAVKNTAIKEEKLPAEKVEVIYNGVDRKRFDVVSSGMEKKKELGLPQDTKIVGCVSNIKPLKGYEYLIEAASSIVPARPLVHFIIIGEDEMNGAIQKQVMELGLQNNVHFLGKRDDVPEFLCIMDVCVFSSLSEGMSNALLEYMAAGRPIVATAIPGNLDLIKDGINGILAPPKDACALEHGIIQLLSDQSLASRLGEAAHSTVLEAFDIDRQLQKMEGFLEGLAGV